MKVIIIAAGRGSRLEHHTDHRPKCMVTVGGASILDHQRAAFQAHHLDDLHIIRGYLADQLQVEGATYYSNENWEQNNILQSLFCAREAMNGPFLSTYSDIIYTPDVVAAALKMPGDINLIVDRQWAQAYQGRLDHPVEQAELVETQGPLIGRVGKHVGPDQALGEFIGLASYTARGAEIIRETFADLQATLQGHQTFRNGRTFQKAYLADFFEELIHRGHPIHCIPIDGGWREIDTVEDLKAVHQFWAHSPVPS